MSIGPEARTPPDPARSSAAPETKFVEPPRAEAQAPPNGAGSKANADECSSPQIMPSLKKVILAEGRAPFITHMYYSKGTVTATVDLQTLKLSMIVYDEASKTYKCSSTYNVQFKVQEKETAIPMRTTYHVKWLPNEQPIIEDIATKICSIRNPCAN
jgi:hypothetical protein